jgi:hypothetical protein
MELNIVYAMLKSKAKFALGVNGHLKTGTFGHEKSSTKSWKLIPPLHQSDLVEPYNAPIG